MSDFNQAEYRQTPAPPPQVGSQSGITANNLLVRYGDLVALADVSLQIKPHEHVAIMGPSGSGKSTLLHALSGIIHPDRGQVSIGDTQITALSDSQRSRLRLTQLGFVFQDGQLLDELPARENVALPMMLAGIGTRQARERADYWLSRLGIAEVADRRPGQMSGGQAQRVALARAIAPNPSVIFTDEPTGALDQASGHEVMQLLTTSCAMTGATLIVVTHDKSVARWCNRLIEVRDGMIHADSALTRPTVQGTQHSQGAQQ